MYVARETRSLCMIGPAATLGIDSSTSRVSVSAALAGTFGVKMCNGVALRGTCRSPGVTLRARSLGRYTLPPRRRVDDKHLPRVRATDTAPSLTPTAPTAFLCSHPVAEKGILSGQARRPRGCETPAPRETA